MFQGLLNTLRSSPKTSSSHPVKRHRRFLPGHGVQFFDAGSSSWKQGRVERVLTIGENCDEVFEVREQGGKCASTRDIGGSPASPVNSKFLIKDPQLLREACINLVDSPTSDGTDMVSDSPPPQPLREQAALDSPHRKKHKEEVGDSKRESAEPAQEAKKLEPRPVPVPEAVATIVGDTLVHGRLRGVDAETAWTATRHEIELLLGYTAANKQLEPYVPFHFIFRLLCIL